ncbi:MAG: hypothetical protein PHN69_02595 [Candidatus Pacebacteria bacterium]|nr:hypothetical protein [Candidatus Paceibacterota bacterium]
MKPDIIATDRVILTLTLNLLSTAMNEQYSPFENTGARFKNDVFEVQAYDWGNEEGQEYNFKYKDFEVRWYKYLGRGTTQNRYIDEEELNDLLIECAQSLNKKTSIKTNTYTQDEVYKILQEQEIAIYTDINNLMEVYDDFGEFYEEFSNIIINKLEGSDGEDK